MFLWRFRIILWLALAGLPAPIAAQTGDVINGVVSDEVNGRLLDSVTVSAGQFKAVTDSLGVFTLTITGAVTGTMPPVKPSDIRWHPATGAFTWDGYAGEVVVAVYSFQGIFIARGGSPASSFSLAHLPQGIYTVVIEAGAQRIIQKIGSLQGQGISSFALLSRKVMAKVATPRPYTLTFARANVQSKSLVVPAGYDGSRIDVKMRSTFPLKNVFRLFLDPKIPAKGRGEGNGTKTDWQIPSAPAQHIGGGLGRHNMLLFGMTNRRISLVLDGKVVWKYEIGISDSFDIIKAKPTDVWMLSNGNIIYSARNDIFEITPMKQILWQYIVPYPSEVYSVQPIGLDKVLFVEEQQQSAHVKLYNTKTRTIELDKAVDTLKGVRGMQCWRLRSTGKGTFIAASAWNRAAHLFDKDFNLLWTYPTAKSTYSAIALQNGNFLVQVQETGNSIELNDKGEPVWSFNTADIALPAGSNFKGTPTSERLSNGNTVLFGTGSDSSSIQAVEVTPEKQAVWFLQDWVNLGDVYSAQFLDEPGYPEIPGETNH